MCLTSSVDQYNLASLDSTNLLAAAWNTRARRLHWKHHPQANILAGVNTAARYLAISIAILATIARSEAQTEESKDIPTLAELEALGEALQLEERANEAQDMALFFKISREFDDDIAGRRAPSNAAAAAKYSAKYSVRRIATPQFETEFTIVAANLAYDAVAEAADAAELAAEIAALAKDGETAQTAAELAGYYSNFAQRFHDEVRESDAPQSGQRVLRAISAADRAERFAARANE